MEQFDDANDAYYEYRQKIQINKKGFPWLSEEIQRLTFGYGVRPWNAIGVGLVIILIFSCFFYERNENRVMCFWNYLYIKSKKLDNIINKRLPLVGFTTGRFYMNPLKISWRSSKFHRFKSIIKNVLYILTPSPSWDSFYFSWVTFITLGTLKSKNDKDKIGFMLEGLLGWLILALFLITLTNVMIRP